MKALVLKENLHKATTIVGKGISTKTQLPILSNILIEATPGQLKLSATNLETSISYWIGAQVEEEGALTIPARLFAELISTFAQEKVQLTSNKAQLQLVCGESEATLAGIDAAEFPPIPQSETTATVALDKELFGKDLPFMLVSSSSDEGRPMLTGIRFTNTDDKLLMVATDGFRLSLKELPKQSGITDSFVIPAKVLSEVFRLAATDDSKTIALDVSGDKNQALFKLENATIATRLIEGEYPPYRKIIPSSYTTRVTLDRVEFAQSVKFAAVFAKEAANIIKLKIGGSTVQLTANSPQLGENKTAVAATIEGEGGEIAFNARFLIDVLNVFPDDQVVFEMTGPLAPGVFKSPHDASYLHIIMPVRVQG